MVTFALCRRTWYHGEVCSYFWHTNLIQAHTKNQGALYLAKNKRVYLEELQGVNFRSFRQVSLHFAPGLNLLLGANGSGKSNLLEMIHYLCLTKSMRRSPDALNIHHGQKAFALHGVFVQEGSPRLRVSIGYERKGGKELKVNDKTMERLADHVSTIPIVGSTPQDAWLVEDGGDLKRRFMNAAIAQYDNQYLAAYAQYREFLGQRNALLKKETTSRLLYRTVEMLLARWATPLREARQAYCEALEPWLSTYYQRITPPEHNEKAGLCYRPNGGMDDLTQKLEQEWARDQRLQYTTVGPHRDTLSFTLNGYALRREGSQGQQKSFMLALRLAQWRLMSERIGRTPLLLLDDPFDRLDAQRSHRLLQVLCEPVWGQVFITHSGEWPTAWGALWQEPHNTGYRVTLNQCTPIS